MGRITGAVLATTRGVYDILAAYLLALITLIALISLALHAGASMLAVQLGHESATWMWMALGQRLHVDPLWLKLVFYGGAHGLLLWSLRDVLARVVGVGERGFDVVRRAHLWVGQRSPGVHGLMKTLFTLGVSAALLPFVVQPTLVGLAMDQRAWTERAANLLDGSATLALHESVTSFYRRLGAPPVPPAPPVSVELVEEQVTQHERLVEAPGTPVGPAPQGAQPLMDRWDRLIWEAAAHDPRRFAKIKAFMWVESGGRQFAVSHTGCAGLMQFCAGTARQQPFRDIFGAGRVVACGCQSSACYVSPEAKRAMERGDAAIIAQHRADFPCDLSDARFDGARAIRAGAAYVALLERVVGGNLALMYVGYNSGPKIARAVYERLGARGADASLDEIEPHLAAVMTPYYGAGASGRARSLHRTHLPKLLGAYQRYLDAAQQTQRVSAAPARLHEEAMASMALEVAREELAW